MTEFKDALDWCAHEFRGRTIYEGHPIQTIERALLIADRLMQEPSDAVLDRGEYVSSEWLNDAAPLNQRRYRLPAQATFKAMRDQMLAEIDNADYEIPHEYHGDD